MRFSTLLFICLTYSYMAQAETIHRCADQSGKVSYSTTPCAAGTSQVKTLDANPVAPPAAPSPETRGPNFKEEERAFQERHSERMEREAAERRDVEEDARRREDEERAEKQWADEERFEPAHPYDRVIRERHYLRPAP
jgi:hypothetical protein